MSLSACLFYSVRRGVDAHSVIYGCQKTSQLGIKSNVFEQQVRWMSRRVKRRHTLQPFWHAAVTRTKYPEHITPENEEFLQAAVEQKYSSPLALEPWPRGEWAPKSQRCGLIGKKIGYYPMWKRDGTKIVTTLIHISDNHVIRYVPAEELIKNSHRDEPKVSKKPRGALVVGADSADPRLFTREYFNMFEKCGVMPKKKLTKFLVTDNGIIQPGTPLYATHFRPGDLIDVSGYTIDRGFQGVVRRWGMKGGPALHGSTKFHNKGGYIGCGGERARVLPGKKMPGHMGMEFRTLRGVQIVRVNSQYNCLWVRGPLPGSIGCYLNLYDSGLHHYRYRDAANHPPFPTHYPADSQVPQVDWHAEFLQPFVEETITFEDVATGTK